MLSYWIVVAFLPTIFAHHHHIVPCPGGLPAPTDVRFPGCDSWPCSINQRDVIPYQLDFVATHSTDNLRLSMIATIFGADRTVNLPPEIANACNSLVRGACPVTQGESLTQGTTLPAPTDYHGGIPARVKLTISDIMDGHEHVSVCVLLDFVIY